MIKVRSLIMMMITVAAAPSSSTPTTQFPTIPLPQHFPRALNNPPHVTHSSHSLLLPPPSLHSSPPLHFLRRRAKSIAAAMSVGDSIPPPPAPANMLDILPFELNHDSDFDQIISPDGLVSICGFGSLLSGSITRQFLLQLHIVVDLIHAVLDSSII